jgi:hypothetical protein
LATAVHAATANWVDLQLPRGRLLDGRGSARRRGRAHLGRSVARLLFGARPLADDEPHLAALAVLRLEVLQEDVEQVVAHPVDHELARVGERQLVLDQADRPDRLEVRLEGVAAESPPQAIDGAGPQIDRGTLGRDRNFCRGAIHRLVHNCGQGARHRKSPGKLSNKKKPVEPSRLVGRGSLFSEMSAVQRGGDSGPGP